MVISLNIRENEIGDRGSKSVVISTIIAVKEQRVDGSYYMVISDM